MSWECPICGSQNGCLKMPKFTPSPFLKHQADHIKELEAENQRLQDTISFQEKEYLKDHEHWGECKFKAENAELKQQLEKMDDMGAAIDDRHTDEVAELKKQNRNLHILVKKTGGQLGEVSKENQRLQRLVDERGKWIPIEERLPDTKELVIVHGGVAIYKDGEWITQTGLDAGRPIQWDVTHWMPLPDPPDTDNGKVKS